MLPLRKGLCDLCDDGEQKELIAGRCKYHYSQGMGRQSYIVRRGIRSIQTIPSLEEVELEAWYDRIINGMLGQCWECNSLIATWNRRYAKAAIAHILPKEYFPSVQNHPLNFLILGATCGCHHRWDDSIDKAVHMTVFPIALERFQHIYPETALAERRRIPEIFINSVNT